MSYLDLLSGNCKIMVHIYVPIFYNKGDLVSNSIVGPRFQEVYGDRGSVVEIDTSINGGSVKETPKER